MAEADRTGREGGDGLENWAAMILQSIFPFKDIPVNIGNCVVIA